MLIVFAGAYGAVSFDRPPITAALADTHQLGARDRGQRPAGRLRPRGLADLRRRLLAGARRRARGGSIPATSRPRTLADHRSPTLVRHFATHGYRTVGWIPGCSAPGRRPASTASTASPMPTAPDCRRPPSASGASPTRPRWRASRGQAGRQLRRTVGTPQAAQAGLLPASAGDTSASAPTSRPGGARGDRCRVARHGWSFFATVSTRPFAAIPTCARTGRGCARTPSARGGGRSRGGPCGVSWTRAAPRLSGLDALPARLARRPLAHHAAQELVLIVIGDHQPIGTVSGRTSHTTCRYDRLRPGCSPASRPPGFRRRPDAATTPRPDAYELAQVLVDVSGPRWVSAQFAHDRPLQTAQSRLCVAPRKPARAFCCRRPAGLWERRKSRLAGCCGASVQGSGAVIAACVAPTKTGTRALLRAPGLRRADRGWSLSDASGGRLSPVGC